MQYRLLFKNMPVTKGKLCVKKSPRSYSPYGMVFFYACILQKSSIAHRIEGKKRDLLSRPQNI